MPALEKTYLEKVREALQAAREGNVEALRSFCGREEELEKAGENWADLGLLSPNVRDNRWRTLLMYACSFGQKDAVKYLAQHPGCTINIKDDCQMTALHHACRKSTPAMKALKHDKNQAGIVRTLVASGCSINVGDAYGVTPLMYAVDSGDRVITYTLLYHDANARMQDFHGYSSMSYAEHKEDIKMGTTAPACSSSYC